VAGAPAASGWVEKSSRNAFRTRRGSAGTPRSSTGRRGLFEPGRKRARTTYVGAEGVNRACIGSRGPPEFYRAGSAKRGRAAPPPQRCGHGGCAVRRAAETPRFVEGCGATQVGSHDPNDGLRPDRNPGALTGMPIGRGPVRPGVRMGRPLAGLSHCGSRKGEARARTATIPTIQRSTGPRAHGTTTRPRGGGAGTRGRAPVVRGPFADGA